MSESCIGLLLHILRFLFKCLGKRVFSSCAHKLSRKEPSALISRLDNLFHRHVLLPLSTWYAKLYPQRIARYAGIIYLPFNTLLKFGSRIREEEALAIELAHSLGVGPRLLSYGDLGPGKGHSIWMTAVPGNLLNMQWNSLSEGEISTIMTEIDAALVAMQSCAAPSPMISAIGGGPVRSFRVPKLDPNSHEIGPFVDEASLHEFLISPASSIIPKHEEYMAKWKQMAEKVPHKVVFTHGDLHRHNIMVKDGHLSGFIDWECAGWYPSYWDYITMVLRVHSHVPDWRRAVASMPSHRFADELEYEIALCTLTFDSWAFYL